MPPVLVWRRRVGCLKFFYRRLDDGWCAAKLLKVGKGTVLRGEQGGHA